MTVNQPLVLRSVAEVRAFMAQRRSAGEAVGLVPTMGALHEGHLSLARASQAECGATLATIFVNPTQFGPSEDFARYPRTLEADLAKLASCGVAAVFAPPAEEVYPPGFSTAIEPPAVAKPLEGALRPDHFRGVCTVVLKLFLISGARAAYFGQKDYQQARVIQSMVDDLNVPLEVRICPIVREADGLAMSSRNAYLDPEQRQQALGLYRALKAADEAFLGGQSDPAAVVARAEAVLRESRVERIDYVAAVDPLTLAPVDRLRTGTVLAIAAHVGTTRLIDNWRLGVD